MPNHGDGPIPARLMIVGEAWGEEEEREGVPFVGNSGKELNKMLHEVGIIRAECYVTNVVNLRPPANDLSNWIAFKKDAVTSQHVEWRGLWVLPAVVKGYQALLAEIAAVQPNIIVAFGNLSLHALIEGCISTKNGKMSGILKWRGSQLRIPDGPKVIPTIHPAAVLREWPHRATVVNDLRRVKRHMQSREYEVPRWNFITHPSYSTVASTLFDLLQRSEKEEFWIDLDLETVAGHIDCCGLSWSRTEAICIPFLNGQTEFWQESEEARIVYGLYKLLTHPHVNIRWQNGLYDAQYIYRRWHFLPRGRQDTMISQHSIFSDLQKSLAFQASMYAEWYVYWKDEGKRRGKDISMEGHWRYNCQDCVYTREVGEVELFTAERLGLSEVHQFQQDLFHPVLKAMLRGVRVIEENAANLAAEIQEQISLREEFLQTVLGYQINSDSPKQIMALFYEDLQQPMIMTRAKKGQPSHPNADDEALQTIARRQPILRPLTSCIADLRTLQKFLGDFVMAKRDFDGRMRCSFNIGGSESGKSAPKTFRLSSSKNPFGSGMNLQTIPSEKSKSIGKWEQRQHFSMIGDPYSLPNLRSMFGPDTGFTFFDMDLDRADLQVVVWEADDQMLKTALRIGADIHLLNAFVLDEKEPPPLEELVESHPKYPDHRGPRKLKREFAKVFCHATNYGGGSRTVAINTGRTVHEIDRAQRIWFGAHPGIETWQGEIKAQVLKRHYVENKFNYRWYIFDRLDAILPEALAWIPQSTVSIVINKIWMNIYKNIPEVEVLLQVHDSLAGQFPRHRKDHCLSELLKHSQVTIPYPDPLIIPTGIGVSDTSWGDC